MTSDRKQAIRGAERWNAKAGKWFAALLVIAAIGGGAFALLNPDRSPTSGYRVEKVEHHSDQERVTVTDPVTKRPVVLTAVSEGNTAGGTIELARDANGRLYEPDNPSVGTVLVILAIVIGFAGFIYLTSGLHRITAEAIEERG